MFARVVIISQFAILVLLLGLGVLFAKFGGGGFKFMLVLFGTPLVILSTIVVLVWAVWRPTWLKVLVGLACALVACGLIAATPFLSRAGDRLFFESRREQFEVFTQEVLAFGRIRSMSDGMRHFKELNGELVAYTPTQVDTTRSPGLRATLPVEQILARDGIARADYERFRARLRDLKMIEFEVHDGFVAYLYDGMLDNLEGYLYVLPDGQPPALRSEVFTTMLVSLRPLGSGWYWFATT